MKIGRILASAAFACGLGQAVQAATLSISCGAVGAELQVCREGVEAWARQTGHTVNIVSTPNDANERLALYQQLLSAQTGDIDVFQIDVIWPGILASHFIDLGPAAKDTIGAHFKSIVENNTVGGRLVAVPWFTDAGLLYYRRDLLEKHGASVPTTWAELTATAKKVQDAERAGGNARFFGYVFQGRASESLTCNALEWFDSHGAGAFVDARGEITVNNRAAAAALTQAASWVGSITPEGVLNYAEEESRGVFQSGNALFMRNWPYAWALANGADSPIRGKVGVAALPSGGEGGKPTGTLGGWQLAVSRYSKNQAVATELVLYLTSQAEQKRRAIAGSYLPTIPVLYQDREVLAANPYMGDLLPTFQSAVARPSKVTGTRYNRVSNAVWNATHSVLSGRARPEAALAELDAELKRIRRNGW